MKHAPSIIIQLVHIHGPLKGKIQEFNSHEITIGRHASCDLKFPQDLVVISRKHADIIRDGNRFKIMDHSTNGTFVNGKRINEAYLKNGDVIFFTEGGPKVSFLTRVGQTMESSPVPPVQEPSNPTPKPELQVSQPCHAVNNPPSQAVHPPVIEQESQPIPAQPIPRQAPSRIETVKAPLVIQYGPVLQSFNELPVTIGTQPDCELSLSHPELLDRHVQIFFDHGSYRIKDLTGMNQILINNQPIVSPAALTPGDKVFFTPQGPAFNFMEGGRMLEISIPQKKASIDIENKERKLDKEPLKEKKGSLFKKIFG